MAKVEGKKLSDEEISHLMITITTLKQKVSKVKSLKATKTDQLQQNLIDDQTEFKEKIF